MPETQRIATAVLDNGLVLVGESMPHVQSAAFTFLTPMGAADEPEDRAGAAGMLGEWIMRGAGDRDSRELIAALDELGAGHSISTGTIHTVASVSTLGEGLIPALEIFADVLRRPRLETSELEPIRDLAIQALQGLEDDPGSLSMVELRKRFYPHPWGKPAVGTREGLESTTADDLRALFDARMNPNGAILGVAGAIDWDELVAAARRLFGDWAPRPARSIAVDPGARGDRAFHLTRDTQQIQIGLAFPSVTTGHPDYYLARVATSILGGYSSSRLFTEVREKLGLCYSVSAGYEGYRELAGVICHAGTSADRAQTTLDVMWRELVRLRDEGVTDDELATMRAGLKTSLIMQQESSLSRSGALASDQYHLGRVRSLDEISEAMDRIGRDDVNRFAAGLPIEDSTVLTLGPSPLRLPWEE